jgi:hypothetical protein
VALQEADERGEELVDEPVERERRPLGGRPGAQRLGDVPGSW